MSSREGIGGREAGLIDYREVYHNTKEYTVGTLRYNGDDIQFVIDKDDYILMKDRPWHLASGKYISSGIIHDNKKKELYLHKLIMKRLEHPGKGATETVDHINRNGLDNRKENLRICTHHQNNMNKGLDNRNIDIGQTIIEVRSILEKI